MSEPVVSAAQIGLSDSRLLFEKAVIRMNQAIWRVTDLQRTREWSHPAMRSACIELDAHRENVRSALKNFRAAVLQAMLEERLRIELQRDDVIAELETLALLVGDPTLH